MIYLLHTPTGAKNPDVIKEMQSAFDVMPVDETTWLISHKAGIDLLDMWIEERFGDDSLSVLVEVSGDFSLQGVSDGTMKWIETRASK